LSTKHEIDVVVTFVTATVGVSNGEAEAEMPAEAEAETLAETETPGASVVVTEGAAEAEGSSESENENVLASVDGGSGESMSEADSGMTDGKALNAEVNAQMSSELEASCAAHTGTQRLGVVVPLLVVLGERDGDVMGVRDDDVGAESVPDSVCVSEVEVEMLGEAVAESKSVAETEGAS